MGSLGSSSIIRDWHQVRLEILDQCGKRVKTKSHRVSGVNPYVCRSYRGKTGRVKLIGLNFIFKLNYSFIVTVPCKACKKGREKSDCLTLSKLLQKSSFEIGGFIIKQTSLTRRLTILEQKRSFQPQFGLVRP